MSAFVFEGEVQSVNNLGDRAEFSVEQAIKGNVGAVVTVRRGREAWGSAEFEVGKRYRVYADSTMSVQPCSGTVPLDTTLSRDTAFLDEGFGNRVTHREAEPTLNLTVPFLIVLAIGLGIWEWWERWQEY